MARPTILTPELQEQICSSIAAGNFAETACRSAGVSTSTFYRWRGLGETEESGIHTDFVAALEAAEAEAESNAVAVVQDGMSSDPRLAMTFLERRFPPRWQRRNAQPEKSIEKPQVTAVSIRVVRDVDENGNPTETIKTVDYTKAGETYRLSPQTNPLLTGAPSKNGEGEGTLADGSPLIQSLPRVAVPPVPVN